MITEKQISHNRQAYYLSRLDWLALTIVGIIDIWTKHGLKLAQILLLQGIFGLFVMVLEFPSGILADLTKRKYLIVVSYLSIILGVLSYLVANSFTWFVIAELFFAIGLAGKSGADTAHLYDTYLEQDRRKDAEKIIATGKSITYAGIMIMTAIGGVFVQLEWRLPLLIAVGGYSLSGIAYLRTYEPDRIKIENSSTAITDSVRLLRKPSVVKVALLLLFVNVFLRISFWDYLPRMELLGVNPVWYGILLAGANAIALISSLAIRKFPKLVDMDLIFVIGGIIGLFLFLNQTSLILVLCSILLHQIYRGSSNVIYDIKLNEQVESDIRASLASLISAIIQGCYFILILGINFLSLSTTSIHQLNAAMGLIIGFIIVTLAIKSKQTTLFNTDTWISPGAD